MRIVGFRAHRLGEDGRLLPVNNFSNAPEWVRGQNEAVVGESYDSYSSSAAYIRAAYGLPPEAEEEPSKPVPQEIQLGTAHGFHAHYRHDFAREDATHVITAVTGWGRMVLHRDGWRSQFAEIHAVLSTQKREIDDAIRKRYDVPILGYPDELLEEGLRYGVEVTDPSADAEGIREIAKAAPRDPYGYPSLYFSFSASTASYSKAIAQLQQQLAAPSLGYARLSIANGSGAAHWHASLPEPLGAEKRRRFWPRVLRSAILGGITGACFIGLPVDFQIHNVPVWPWIFPWIASWAIPGSLAAWSIAASPVPPEPKP